MKNRQPSQPNRDMHPQDRASCLKLGMTQADIDAYESGDVDYDFEFIASEAGNAR